MRGQLRRLPDEALLETFLDELYRWNERLRLTTVPRELARERHVSESLQLVGAVPPPPGSLVADLGSGTGVPGLPLAIIRPDIRVTLIEADRRKSGFLVHITGLLELPNVGIETGRAETLAHEPRLRERFDMVVTRAAAPPAALCELALPFLRPGGRLAALVADSQAAARAGRHAARLCGGGEPAVPARGVLCVAKAGPTPAHYPRRPGVPARRPLRADAT